MASCGSQQDDGANNQKSHQELVTIDPDGDLILVVGSTKTLFVACSKTLSRSALFWKRCLYGPFREGKPANGQDWVVEFPADNPSAMKYVLLLAHALVHKLPKITLQLAFEVTVLTNKYDMTRLLWAVSRSWLEDMPPEVMTSHDTIAPELQWLWVTKELGEIDEYSRSFASLSQIVSTTAEDDGILSLRRPFRPDDGSVITRESLKGYDAEKDVILLIAEDIKSARGDALRKIQYPIGRDVWILKHTVKSFDSSKGCDGARICTGRTSDGSLLQPNKRRFCEYAMQSIVAKLSASKDSAMKPAAAIGVSAETYLEIAARFRSRIENEIALVCGEEHKNCTPFKSKLPSKKDLMEMTSLSWRNRNHKAFEKQARISGLDKGGEIDDNLNEDEGGSGRKRSRNEFEAAASA